MQFQNFNSTGVADYYEDGSEYTYEDYEDDHLPIRPVAPLDETQPPTRSQDAASAAQLGPSDEPAPMPDLKITVSIDVVDTSVQALVVWTQPMDIRPTSYTVRWNRVSCEVDTSVLPPCGLREQLYSTSIKATSEKVGDRRNSFTSDTIHSGIRQLTHRRRKWFVTSDLSKCSGLINGRQPNSHDPKYLLAYRPYLLP